MRRLTLILPFDIAIYAALPKAHVQTQTVSQPVTEKVMAEMRSVSFRQACVT